MRDTRYALFGDYLDCFPRLAGLYDYSPFDPASFDARAKELAGFDGDRVALAGLLEEYNRSLGAPPEALASARRLADGRAVVVIAGQQPGVLTGPLYTFWKAAAVLQLAAAAQARLGPGTPVVPVFWIGAEDHDLAEIAPVWVLTPRGSVERHVYDPTAGGGPSPAVRTSVGYLPAGRAAVALLDRLEPDLWPTEFTPGVMTHLRSTAETSADLAEWFGRLMLSLFGKLGLIVANPMHPGLRALEGPIFRRMVADNAAVASLLGEGQERVRALGYEPQVEKDPAAANLYLYEGTERVPLYREGSGFRVGLGPGPAGTNSAGPGSAATAMSAGELDEIAARTPERLSTNVVLRPLAQDAVFPVLTYVGGPGETSYFALYRGIYHHFGRRMPIIYPRPNVTLIEPAVGRHLARCGLGPEGALDLEALRRAKAAYLDSSDPVGIASLFDGLTAKVGEAYAGLPKALAAVDPSLGDLVAKNLARVNIEIDWLRNKTSQQHRQNCRDALRRFEAIELSLRPQGDYQERVFSIFAYAAKYGLAAAEALASLPVVPADGGVDTSHRFVWL